MTWSSLFLTSVVLSSFCMLVFCFFYLLPCVVQQMSEQGPQDTHEAPPPTSRVAARMAIAHSNVIPLDETIVTDDTTDMDKTTHSVDTTMAVDDDTIIRDRYNTIICEYQSKDNLTEGPALV